MDTTSRRDALLLAMAATAASAIPTRLAAAATGKVCNAAASSRWRHGIEGQRHADLGNGQFLNPVLAGDHPDPSVLKDGDVYYKVSSSFFYYPGLIVWQSHDLVNWTPLGPALQKPIGSIFAPDIVKHNDRFFIYFPVLNLPKPGTTVDPSAPRIPTLAIYAVHATSMTGPWSDPVDLSIYDGIDPGHIVGEDGKRYLFINDGRLVPLSDDGLMRAGKTEKVYSGWQYPEDWIVEGFALESPKLIRRNGWYYMFSAQGGTGGPPTSHMVVVARARSVRGPWENCPNNPIVRTTSIDEPWWSRGHATPIEGPRGDWWMIYHGYENGFRTLGRQMLLDPFDWTTDGWPRAQGGDLGQPLAKPRGGTAGPAGAALSDDFSKDRFGVGLSFFKPRQAYCDRARFDRGTLALTGLGNNPGESSPLLLNVGDRDYQVTVELDLTGNAQAGLLLFYDERFFCGFGTNGRRFTGYKRGAVPPLGPQAKPTAGKIFLKVRNQSQVATFFYSSDGKTWKLYSSIEISGYNHNIADGFLSLRPGLFVIGDGAANFQNLTYIAIK